MLATAVDERHDEEGGTLPIAVAHPLYAPPSVSCARRIDKSPCGSLGVLQRPAAAGGDRQTGGRAVSVDAAKSAAVELRPRRLPPLHPSRFGRARCPGGDRRWENCRLWTSQPPPVGRIGGQWAVAVPG